MFDSDDFFNRTGIKLAEAGTLDASVVTPVGAFQATQRFGGPSPFGAGAAWCFERLGQSVTVLPEGRRVFIAGEHEDNYDPDFHIYNDVAIWSPDGTIEVLGYPKEVNVSAERANFPTLNEE